VRRPEFGDQSSLFGHRSSSGGHEGVCRGKTSRYAVLETNAAEKFGETLQGVPSGGSCDNQIVAVFSTRLKLSVLYSSLGL